VNSAFTEDPLRRGSRNVTAQEAPRRTESRSLRRIQEIVVDQDRFDALTRSLSATTSRRGLGRALTGGGLAALVGERLTPHGVGAKKKKGRKNRNKPKKLPINEFRCVNVGKPCAGKNGTCCSGICQGKKPKKGKKDRSTCVAHNAGICSAEADSCTVGEVQCNPGNPSCLCTLTTGNAGFCAAFSGGTSGHCRVCRKDTDCEPEFGAGAACLVMGGACTPLCIATGRTACAPPCV
jgi:hypothetical protein